MKYGCFIGLAFLLTVACGSDTDGEGGGEGECNVPSGAPPVTFTIETPDETKTLRGYLTSSALRNFTASARCVSTDGKYGIPDSGVGSNAMLGINFHRELVPGQYDETTPSKTVDDELAISSGSGSYEYYNTTASEREVTTDVESLNPYMDRWFGSYRENATESERARPVNVDHVELDVTSVEPIGDGDSRRGTVAITHTVHGSATIAVNAIKWAAGGQDVEDPERGPTTIHIEF